MSTHDRSKPSQEREQGLAPPATVPPHDFRCERTPGGLVRAVLGDGITIEPAEFHRTFPFSAPDEFISIRDAEGVEHGLLADLADFPTETAELIRQELRRRYFAPHITRIETLTEKFGRSHWTVQTDAGPTSFEVQNEHANLRDLPNGMLLLIDIHGNRYLLPPRAELDGRVRRQLEAMF